MSRPNILFITADQWRGDCLSAVGHPHVRTPHIDGLARAGVTFRRHFAQAAPCGPSRASLYTGTYLHTHRAVLNGTPLAPNLTNIAREARAAGYRPALFGYTDTTADPRGLTPGDPRLTSYEGVLDGFDPVMPLLEDFAPFAADLRRRGYDFGPEKQAFFKPVYDDQGRPHTMFGADESETRFLARAFTDWLSDQAEPWFAHVSFYRPHPPFVAAPPYHAYHDPDRMPRPRRRALLAAEAAQHPYLAFALSQQRYRAPVDDRAVQQATAAYFGLMSQVDDAIGDIVYALHDREELKRTLIIFTSDHGEMLGDHWLTGKLGFYDGAYHVPLIVRDPRPEFDRTRGRRVDAFSESVDILPTVMDLIGQAAPDQTQGLSLRPWLTGELAPWRDAAHWEYDFRDPATRAAETLFDLPADRCNLGVIRDDRFKYVHFAGLDPLLFDLVRDPGETTDLARDPDHAGIAARYARRLLSWRQSSDDRSLTRWKLAEGGPYRAPD